MVQGTYTLTKLSAVDKLEQLLLCYGPESEEVKNHFIRFKVGPLRPLVLPLREHVSSTSLAALKSIQL